MNTDIPHIVASGPLHAIHPWFEGSENQPIPVPEDLAHRVPGVTFVISEWRDYHVTIPKATRLKVGSTWITPVGSSHTFIVNISNQLGLTEFTPYFHGHAGETMYIEVLATKFPTLRDSLDFTESLVDQLSARIRALPFVVRAETSRQIVRDHGEPNLFFTFHYLRHHGADMVRALSVITADPHRKLADIVENVRIHQTRRIDAEAVNSLLTGPRAGNPDRSPGARAIDRLQPLRIAQRRPEETYDTPENRFVVAACRRLKSVMTQIQEQHWWENATGADARLFRYLERAIRLLLQSSRFRQIEASLHIPSFSRVLQMKPGYRELTIFWSGLSQIHIPELVRISKAVDLRDVPTLYEYWQFFELVEALSGAIGTPADMSLDHETYPKNWGLKARFPGVGTIFTQRSFGGNNTYTPVTLRPDFVWERTDGRMVLLDAKFAMSSPNDFQQDEETTPSSRASSRDITKMHGYRDAIRGARAALVLYPGTEGKFWGKNGASRSYANITGIIEEIVNCELDGIGAIPMVPKLEGRTF